MCTQRSKVDVGITAFVPEGDLQKHAMIPFGNSLYSLDEFIQTGLFTVGFVIQSTESDEQCRTWAEFGQE